MVIYALKADFPWIEPAHGMAVTPSQRAKAGLRLVEPRFAGGLAEMVHRAVSKKVLPHLIPCTFATGAFTWGLP